MGRFLSSNGAGLTAAQLANLAPINGAGTSGTWPISVTGQSGSASKLQTPVNIAGVSFDGSGNITIPFANLAGKPTTIAGYGITDAQGAPTWSAVTGKPTTVGGFGITDALTTSYAPSWSSMTGKPTTLAGFGITDGVTAASGMPFSSITGKPTTLAGYGITDGNGAPAWSAVTSKPTTVTGFGITDAVKTTDTIAIAQGGTGATTAAGALTALGGASSTAMTTGDTNTLASAKTYTDTSIATEVTNRNAAISTAVAAVPTGNLNVVLVAGTAQTAVAGNMYVLNNVAATTLTLPIAPVSGDTIGVKVNNGLFTNVIAHNGKTIMGIAEDLMIDSSTITVELKYINNDWSLV